MDFIIHEKAYRSQKILDKRSSFNIFILGAGALGSNLVPLLIKNGFSSLKVLDKDRIERHNVGNQYYTLFDVGKRKISALKSHIYRGYGVEIQGFDIEAQKLGKKYFSSSDILIDTFDNWESRSFLKNLGLGDKLIHAGMSDQGYAEIKWDQSYHIPQNETKQEDVCEYPLACNLVYLTVSCLCDIICRFCDKGEKYDVTITLNDLNIEMRKLT